jgi:hypothetical protein
VPLTPKVKVKAKAKGRIEARLRFDLVGKDRLAPDEYASNPGGYRPSPPYGTDKDKGRVSPLKGAALSSLRNK